MSFIQFVCKITYIHRCCKTIGPYYKSIINIRDCMRFCFWELLQKGVEIAVVEWNTHRLRPNCQSAGPCGIPDELYFCLSFQV